ncbi:hypothetical protein KM043_014009 [Ampulex compressa]|nr:hypothetical protein KM043_014009 [Ampulex compressa]
MAQINTCLNHSQAQSHLYDLMELSVDDNNLELLYIRGLVKHKFHEINYRSKKILETNNEQQEFMEKENANLFALMSKCAERQNKKWIKCKKENKIKNLDCLPQIRAEESLNDKVMHQRRKFIPLNNHFQQNKDIKKKPTSLLAKNWDSQSPQTTLEANFLSPSAFVMDRNRCKENLNCKRKTQILYH